MTIAEAKLLSDGMDGLTASLAKIAMMKREDAQNAKKNSLDEAMLSVRSREADSTDRLNSARLDMAKMQFSDDQESASQKFQDAFRDAWVNDPEGEETNWKTDDNAFARRYRNALGKSMHLMPPEQLMPFIKSEQGNALRAQIGELTNATRRDIAAGRNETAITTAGIGAESRTGAAQIGADARIEAAKIGAEGKSHVNIEGMRRDLTKKAVELSVDPVKNAQALRLTHKMLAGLDDLTSFTASDSPPVRRGGPDEAAARLQADAAIKAGKDPVAVRARFKQLFGKDL